MGIIIGIDVGGSTTKIVGMNTEKKLISTMMVKAYDQLTSLYGALGNYMDTNGLALNEVERIYITGVGSSFLSGNIYGIPTIRVEEFSAIGRGGLWLTGLDEAIIVSMGTGTAFVHANGNSYRHLGGSGVGGGTLIGLGRKLTSADGFDFLCRLAEKGDISNQGEHTHSASRADGRQSREHRERGERVRSGSRSCEHGAADDIHPRRIRGEGHRQARRSHRTDRLAHRAEADRGYAQRVRLSLSQQVHTPGARRFRDCRRSGSARFQLTRI